MLISVRNRQYFDFLNGEEQILVMTRLFMSDSKILSFVLKFTLEFLMNTCFPRQEKKHSIQ